MADEAPNGMEELFASHKALLGSWDDILQEMEDISQDLRSAGWTTLEHHPGNITVSLDDEECGFWVLVPNDEFDQLEEVIARSDSSFDDYDLYGTKKSEAVFLIVVMKDEFNQTTVLYPIYYNESQKPELYEKADQNKQLFTHIYKLNGESISFYHENPEKFLNIGNI